MPVCVELVTKVWSEISIRRDFNTTRTWFLESERTPINGFKMFLLTTLKIFLFCSQLLGMHNIICSPIYDIQLQSSFHCDSIPMLKTCEKRKKQHFVQLRMMRDRKKVHYDTFIYSADTQDIHGSCVRLTSWQ